MSVSWIYLTRRFLLQNYRDCVAVGMVGMFFFSKMTERGAVANDNQWIQQRIHNNEDHEIKHNSELKMTDNGVKREKIYQFRKQILEARAQKEREAMLDAYNHLNGRSHTLD